MEFLEDVGGPQIVFWLSGEGRDERDDPSRQLRDRRDADRFRRFPHAGLAGDFRPVRIRCPLRAYPVPDRQGGRRIDVRIPSRGSGQAPGRADRARTPRAVQEEVLPQVRIFLAALATLGDVAPEEAIVVGDSPYDAEAAGRAGLRTIGVLCGGFLEAELRETGCVALFRDPADLLARYDNSPLAPGRTT